MIMPFTRGAGYVLQGFRLINRSGIRRYVLIPLLINIVLFGGVLLLGWQQFEDLLQWVRGVLPSWLDWLEWLLWPVFILTALLLVFYLFTPVANVIGAPFNALLAEKLEADLSGERPGGGSGLKGLAVTAGVAVYNAVRVLLYQLLWVIPLLILFVIPVVNVAAPFLWAMFSAWMLSLQYADYPMGNHNMTFGRERRLLRRNRSLSLGFGGGVMIMTMIPVLNFLAMPVGVAGATALWVAELREQALAEK